jgi:hypothetical protein
MAAINNKLTQGRASKHHHKTMRGGPLLYLTVYSLVRSPCSNLDGINKHRSHGAKSNQLFAQELVKCASLRELSERY